MRSRKRWPLWMVPAAGVLLAIAFWATRPAEGPRQSSTATHSTASSEAKISHDSPPQPPVQERHTDSEVREEIFPASPSEREISPEIRSLLARPGVLRWRLVEPRLDLLRPASPITLKLFEDVQVEVHFDNPRASTGVTRNAIWSGRLSGPTGTANLIVMPSGRIMGGVYPQGEKVYRIEPVSGRLHVIIEFLPAPQPCPVVSKDLNLEDRR